MHTQKEIKNIFERHFKEIADACKIEAALLNEAIFQMEDFSIFGVGWQLEVADRNIKEIIRA